MLRCTYRLTGTRKILSTEKLERLPQKGSRVAFNNQQYMVDTVAQEGNTATAFVSEYRNIPLQS